MKHKFASLVAAQLAALIWLGSSLPAQATDAGEAIRLCDKNPKCTYNVRDNGSVDLTVNGNHINCPQEGPCSCEVCTPPAQASIPKPGKKPPLPRVMDVLKR